MKIRNLAFCGVMASILGVSGAYATDATIIASKAYVDARDNTKQDTANIVTTEWANTDANIKSSDARYPSMKTLQTAVGAGTSALDGQNADSETGVSAGAAADNNKIGMPVVKVTETDGIVTSELGAIGTKGISDGAVTYAKVASDSKTTTVSDAASASDAKFPTEKAVRTAIDNGDNAIKNTFEKGMEANTETLYNTWATDPSTASATALSEAIANDRTLDNVVSDSNTGHANLIPRNSNIQKGIAYMNGNGIVNHTKNVDTETLTRNLETAATAWKKEFTDKVADDHVPTVAAVEARVKAAESNATGMKDTAPSATWANDTLTIVTGDNAGNKTDKLATSAQVNTSVSALKSYADYKIGNTAMGTTATTLTGAIAEVKATADGALKDVTQGTGDGEAYVALVKDGTNVKGTKGILTYSGALNHKLSEINTNGGDGSSNCKVGSPCVLTMVMNGSTPVYEWTNMETDGLNADL